MNERLIWSMHREALHNKYAPLNVDGWNQTLRKTKVMHKSQYMYTIRTKHDGSFSDQITGHKAEWKRNVKITVPEVMTLKIYTDFDKLQFELKKCFRAPSFDEDDEHDHNQLIDELAERLQTFYHWRGGLLIVLHKFGSFLNEHNNNIQLYVGVNRKMVLKPSKTLSFSGPLSTSSDYHVANSFATAKGMILKITSNFPRSNFCNAFDASLISDYPEEQEWLVGFMYARLLEVTTRKLSDEMFESFTEMFQYAPVSSLMRETFFALHLFKEQIFSMSDHLERIISGFLKVNRGECCSDSIQKQYEDHYDSKWNPNTLCTLLCPAAGHPKGIEEWELRKANAKTKSLSDNEQKEDIERAFKLAPILWNKFNEFRQHPNGRQCVKFDVISNNLRSFFMEPTDDFDINTKNEIFWRVSFAEICTVYPNIKEIHFTNQYRLDDGVLRNLLRQIQRKENTIQKVVFFYYDYKETDENAMPLNGKIFQNPETLRQNLLNKLKENGWNMKHNKNGNTGYKIRIYDERIYRRK